MKIRKTAAAMALAGAVMTAMTAAAPAIAAPGAKATATSIGSFCTNRPDTGIPGGRDDLGIAGQLSDVRGDSRDDCVKKIMNRAFDAAGGRYNVMVFNLSQEYEDHFNGTKFYGTYEYDGVYYGIWVFEDGSFVNKGDGGWINWGMRGWFDGHGKSVDFHRP